MGATVLRVRWGADSPPQRTTSATAHTVVRAAVVAGALSGLPSTLHALVTRRPLVASVRAAGTLLGRPTIVRGAAAHVAITAFWSAVLVLVLPERRRVAAGLAAGAAIHVLDMEVIGRRLPAMRALPRLPQLADHLAFGALVAATSSRSSRRSRRRGSASRARSARGSADQTPSERPTISRMTSFVPP